MTPIERTEEELQAALARLAEGRHAGDDHVVGHARSDAAKAVGIALMVTHEPAELLALEPEVRRSLEDAHEDGNRYDGRLCYSYMARIAEARGDADEAAKFLHWEADLGESDCLNPLQRWEQEVETLKMIMAMAKRMCSDEMVSSFQAELRRLKKEKPRAT